VNVLHLVVILLHRPQRAVEKAWLPHKARFVSTGIDPVRRTDLDRFHHDRDGERKPRKKDGVPRRGGVRQEHPGRMEQVARTAPI